MPETVTFIPSSLSPSVSLTECSTLLRDIDRRIDDRQDVQTLQVNGDPVIVKKLRAACKSWLAVMTMRVVCRAVFKAPLAADALLRRPSGYELDRLRLLRRQGWRVPKVYLDTHRYMVMEHCGPSVEKLMKSMTSAERIALLQRITDDLARFHSAGHWHGGAQLRNLTLRDDILYRIDFEEPVGDALPLPLAQAFDVALYLASVSDVVGPDSHEGTALLTRYVAKRRCAEVVGHLRRLRPIVALAAAALRCGAGVRKLKADARRAQALSRMLANGL